VKRTVSIAVGLGLLAVGVYVGSQLRAQAPATTAPRPLQTRIGLINMVQVLKNYKKFQNFEQKMRDQTAAAENTLKPFKDDLIKLQAEMNDPKTTTQRKEEIQNLASRRSADAKLKQEEIQRDLVKANGEYVKQVYKEVEEVVNGYARANNLELVLYYNDAITADDYYNPETIKRKLMTPAALIPMVVAPGMDISDQIVTTLNAKFASAPAGVPTSPRGN
jgi:Skp family chaperone for outer membrane proteins